MEKVQKTEGINLLEEMIQRIQSFLTIKESAQTSILSKSWNKAWSTHPDLNLDSRFFYKGFQEFAFKTMNRYEDLRVKIKSFRLKIIKEDLMLEDPLSVDELVVKAMKQGATNLNLTFCQLSKEVLESKTLNQLSLKYCTITCGKVNWCSLKSLKLRKVVAENDVINGILSGCCHSLEELTISSIRHFIYVDDDSDDDDYDDDEVDGMLDGRFGFWKFFSINDDSNRFEKLKVLSLEDVDIHQSFFNTDFSSRFPCLKDLSLINCGMIGYSIRISSPYVEHICFSGVTISSMVQLHLPRIIKLEYYVDCLNHRQLEHSGLGLTLKQRPLGMCESHISIHLDDFYYGDRSKMFLQTLREFLMELWGSQIYLYLNMECKSFSLNEEEEDVDIQPLPQIVLENLTINLPSSGYDTRDTLLKCLYRFCTPLHVNELWT